MDDIRVEVNRKIVELQNILAQKGKGGETDKIVLSNELNSTNSDIKQIKEGGSVEMNPITRDGVPVQDGKLVDPKAISAMAGGGGDVPATDFMALVKANDPHNDNIPSIITSAEKTDAPETNKEINTELKKMPSTKEHDEALKVVEKEVSTKKAQDEISSIIQRAKELKKASEELSNIFAPKEEKVEKMTDKNSILARIRERIQMRKAKETGKGEVGALVDPVKGSEDAGKDPQDSVKSIKTTKAEVKDRPLEPMPEGKQRYSPDKGNDIRDKEAKDAISKGDKDMSSAKKEPDQERPVTNDGKGKSYDGKSVTQKKASIAGRLASIEVVAESDSTWRKDNNFPIKHTYPVEKSPDMDFEGAAGRTEKEINKEHSERAKDKGDITPLKTTLWSDRRRTVVSAKLSPEAQTFISNKISVLKGEGKDDAQASAIAYSMARKEGYDVPEKTGCLDKEMIKKQIQAYKESLKSIAGETPEDIRRLEVLDTNIASLEKEMEKLSYVPMSTKPTKDMSWGEIIAEGNAVYADLQRLFGEIGETVSPFLETVEKKTASLKLAAKEEGEKEEKEEKDDDKGEKADADKTKDKGKSKPKKDKTEDVAEDTIDLLKDIRDTAEDISKDIDKHLDTVEKETGIPVPPAGKGLPPAGLDEGLGLPPLGEKELPMMDEGMGGEKMPPMKLSWIGKLPKTAAEEEELVEAIKVDPSLTPDQVYAELKKMRKTTSWKAVFTKLGEPEAKKDEKEEEKKEKKEAKIDKKNSYWSVFRGDELVVRATVEDLYKDKAVEAFDWASSQEYGRKLLTSVLTDGVHVTASRLGIEAMIKTSAKGKDTDPKAYYRKVYPASYVSEMFKEHKKKAELEINNLKTKIAEQEEMIQSLDKENQDMKENQILHAKAEKAIQLVKIAVDKGLVEQKDSDSVVDGIMQMNDEGFDTFSSTILKAPSIKKATTMEEKINMVKNASVQKRDSVTLDTPIQIQGSETSPGAMLKEQLDKMWKTPPTVNR